MSVGLGASMAVATPPTFEPFEVAEAKLWSNVFHQDDDAEIGRLITMARRKVENDTRLFLPSQTINQSMDRVPCGGDPIPIFAAPLASVVSITAYAEDDTSSVFAASNYFVDTTRVPGRICLKQGCSWPTGLRRRVALVIQVTVGSAAASIPAEFKLAMRLLIENWYGNRDGSLSEDVERGYRALIGPSVLHFIGEEAA